MEEGGRTSNILTVRPTLAGKTLLRRPRRRWEANIRMDLKEIGKNTRNWVDSSQDMDYWRVLVDVALNLRVHKPRNWLVSRRCIIGWSIECVLYKIA